MSFMTVELMSVSLRHLTENFVIILLL